jgi:hypothetical protein
MNTCTWGSQHSQCGRKIATNLFGKSNFEYTVPILVYMILFQDVTIINVMGSWHGALILLEASRTQNRQIKFSNVSWFGAINTQDCSFYSFNVLSGRKRRGKTNSDWDPLGLGPLRVSQLSGPLLGTDSGLAGTPWPSKFLSQSS